MKRRFLGIVVVACALICAAIGATPAQAAKHNCWLKHSTDQKIFGSIRMMKRFSRRDANGDRVDGGFKATYVCSTKYGRHWKLPTGEFPDEDSYAAGPAAGRYFGYWWDEICADICANLGSSMTILDMKTGRSTDISHDLKASGLFDDYYSLPSSGNFYDAELEVVMRSTGTVGVGLVLDYYRYDATSNTSVQAPPVYAVAKIKLGRFGRSTAIALDRVATEQDAKSIKLSGRDRNTLTWTSGGVAKSAPLD